MCLLGVVSEPNGITALQPHSFRYTSSIIVTMVQRPNNFPTTHEALAAERSLIMDFTSISERRISREEYNG